MFFKRIGNNIDEILKLPRLRGKINSITVRKAYLFHYGDDWF